MSLHLRQTCKICVNFYIDDSCPLPEKMNSYSIGPGTKYRINLCLEDFKQGAQIACPLATFLVDLIVQHNTGLLKDEDSKTLMLWVEPYALDFQKSSIPCAIFSFVFWDSNSQCYEPTSGLDGWELRLDLSIPHGNPPYSFWINLQLGFK